MPEVTLQIGGRIFAVACQEGEEPQLGMAAALLDREAQSLLGQADRLTEAKLLLLSGLLLADRTAGLMQENQALTERLAALESQPRPQIEVPVIPPQVHETLAEIAARTEALAAALEDRRG